VISRSEWYFLDTGAEPRRSINTPFRVFGLWPSGELYQRPPEGFFYLSMHLLPVHPKTVFLPLKKTCQEKKQLFYHYTEN